MAEEIAVTFPKDDAKIEDVLAERDALLAERDTLKAKLSDPARVAELAAVEAAIRDTRASLAVLEQRRASLA